MTFEQLNYFLITAKHMNFSLAAKELYISQPAISQQIAMLEKELGTRLFIRTTRRIQLTKSGELFLEDAKRMLDIEEAAKERIQLADTKELLQLNIAYLLAPCQTFLPKVLYEFKKMYPQVKINLFRMDATNIFYSVDEASYDIYFSLSRDLKNHNEYAFKELLTDRFSLICSTEHPCASLTKIDFNKLASEKFLLFDPESASLMSKQIQQFCKSINFNPKMIIYRKSMEEILFEVEAGLGITILPMRNKLMSTAVVTYIPLSGNYTELSLGVAWKVFSDNPAISWLLDVLDQAKENHPEWF